MTTITQDLLIEIGTEDLPARYVRPLAEALAKGVAGGLAKRGVAAGEVRSFATPRRIAVLIGQVGAAQPDQIVERKGPQLTAAYKDGQPTPAALGFARSCGVELSALKQEAGQLVYRRKQKGRRTLELLAEIFEEALKQMDELVPKRMRWGDGNETFVRPVQWLLALYGEKVVPLQRFGLKSGRRTFGHRYHAPAALSLKSPEAYEAALQIAHVWADFGRRRDEIRRQVEAEAERLGGRARISGELLDEVTALVERPVVISGRIEERFLQLPPEVVVATVETNQRYFTVFGADGKLLPTFITISNIASKDPAQVVAGNERVVRPRLTDALFFWEQDRKKPLQANLEALDRVTFVANLGSVLDKTRRMENLAVFLAGKLGVDGASAKKAASLCKADLVTRMVYEFPELQGLMGSYYAAASESAVVTRAIAEHYFPTQAGGPIPSTTTGQVVALADKLDTLAGIFRIGQKPTASKDPFALRRAAIGILRIVVEGLLDLDLREALQTAWDAYPDSVAVAKGASVDDIWAFLMERLRGYALDQGTTAEQFEAVRVMGAARPLDFVRRLEALRSFQQLPAAATLAAADKRARNILRQAGGSEAGRVETGLFDDPSEHALLAELERVESAVTGLRARADYLPMLQALAALKEPVDAFFDKVMVMAEDPAVRANRLALLARLDASCREVADLSCLPS